MATATDLPTDFVRVQCGKTKASIIQMGKGAKGRIVDGESGFTIRTAEIRLADGTLMTGIVDICDQDSGEHYGTAFYLPWSNEIVEQDDIHFREKMRKTSSEIFPYSYRYHGWKDTVGMDCHIDEETGWS